MKNPQLITTYDDLILKAHTEFHLPFDWLLLKAQLIQESGLDPYAKSEVGAEGLAQFMPDTWLDMLHKYPRFAGLKRTNPQASIFLCAAYMNYLLYQWKSPRPNVDRYNLALASYNAGLCNVLKAQKIVKGAIDYKTIISALKFVTGAENALQSTNYVVRIQAIYADMVSNSVKI